VHDAPEVVLEPWLAQQQQQRPTSPYSMDETVVSAFQPLEFDEKGQPVSRRVSELPSEQLPKTCGIPRRYLFGGIILIFAVATALGLGLGLSLGNKRKSNTTQVLRTHTSTQSLTAYRSDPGYADPYCAANPSFCIGGALVRPTTPATAPSTALVSPSQLSFGTIKSER
jgi:hypothetical protein